MGYETLFVIQNKCTISILTPCVSNLEMLW